MINKLLFALLLLAPAMAHAQDVTIADRREADGTLTLSHEVVVAAPAAEIWTAISTPEGWGKGPRLFRLARRRHLETALDDVRR